MGLSRAELPTAGLQARWELIKQCYGRALGVGQGVGQAESAEVLVDIPAHVKAGDLSDAAGGWSKRCRAK